MKKTLTLFLLGILSSLSISQWYQQIIPSNITSLSSICFIDTLNGWACGGNGAIIKTTNGGTDWFILNSGTTQSLNSITFKDTNTGWTCGSNGTILKTFDGGINWSEQSIWPNSLLSNIFFFNKIIGWITGFEIQGSSIVNPKVLKTTDAGNSWFEQFSKPTGLFSDLFFVDSLNGWFCGDKIYKTTDGGSNWSGNNPFPDWIDAIFFINSNIGWIAHSNLGYSKISKTIDAGYSWDEQFSISALGMIFGNIFFIDENNGWVVGPRSGPMSPSTIYRTYNGGITWNYQFSNIMSLSEVAFPSHNRGWTVGQKFISWDSTTIIQAPIILNTTNGGAVPVEFISFAAKIIRDGIQLIWNTATEINNYGFEIQRKTNNTNWTAVGFMEGHGTTTDQHSYTFIDNLDIEDMYFYRLEQIDFDGKSTYSETIEIEFSITPTKFELFQNFPNPFNPTTKIKYSIPSNVKGETSNVLLKLYDVLGNEVSTLVDEYKSAGEYEVDFDPSSGIRNLTSSIGYASGVYFCQLRIGEKAKTMKMILLR